jgi:hypothetical protein
MIKLNNHKSLVSIDNLIHVEAKRHKPGGAHSCSWNTILLTYIGGEKVDIFYGSDEHYYDASSDSSRKMDIDFIQLEKLLVGVE